MFTPLSPILPADPSHGIDTGAFVAQCDGLRIVIAAVARIAGVRAESGQSGLAASADLADAVGRMPKATLRQMATECDTLALTLRAGLMALERARTGGRLNRAAAVLLHSEASQALAGALAKADLPRRH